LFSSLSTRSGGFALIRFAASPCEVICFETALVPAVDVHGKIAELVSHIETLPADIFSA
jgi:hypothetical protein